MSARADLMRLLTAFTSIDRARRLVDLHHAEVLATSDPIVVGRFDAAIEPAPEEEQLLTVGCIAEDGRPVALLLNVEDRARVAGWLDPQADQLRNDVTGACLARWEEEQDNARLRLAWKSARQGRRKAREGVHELTSSEQQFLRFALELAADRMSEHGDEFDADDEAALESLRRLTGEAPRG
ncbi:hypothetical protein [Streptomyces drozdowiczii]|uniref:Uncharacterized protein n=1 Tax=Streptomyces drozdowiczii TaxID=202862 RepID=A0ABY6PPD2_9ACTN|nr:hypothetical protein [Streptomyces drozdowiczii]MCX0246447.1 hypothetical protein [Streptomyces drozdowiczii]UZK54050.1 hypothetical protein NEH16_07710 [Streptomyces drozdowiczii]